MILPSRKSVADRLAQGELVGGVVQRVVNQLEGGADVDAEVGERLFLALGAAGDDGADAAGGGEEGGGLALDDVEVAVVLGREVVLGDELKHLAFGDGGGRFGEDAENFQAAVGRHELEGAAEQEVADEDGGLVAEHGVRCGEAASEAALVHHVVVQEGSGVDEFHAGGEVDGAGTAAVCEARLVAAQAGAGECQDGAQALAAGGDQVSGELRDERHLALHVGDDDAVAGGEVVGHELGERRQRILARMRRGRQGGRRDHGLIHPAYSISADPHPGSSLDSKTYPRVCRLRAPYRRP